MISILAGASLVVMAVVLVILGARGLTAQGERAGLEEMRAIASRQGMEEGQFFWKAYGATSVLDRQMLEMKKRGNHRDSASIMVKATLEGNPDFVGVGTGWEPDAWDGKDADWKDKKCHDASGRFIPYWSRSDKGMTCDPLVDYDKPVAGDYYLLPKQTGKDMLIDPYAYPVGGVTVLMATVVSAMMDDGKFVGITSADINLAPLQAKADSFDAFERTGRMTVIGNTGLVAARTGNPAAITKSFDGMDSASAREMFETTRDGREWIELDGDTMRVAVPLKIIEGDKPWTILVEAPRSTVLAGARRSERTMVFASLLILAAMFGVSQYLLRRMTAPLGRIAKASEKLSKGDPDVELRLDGHDELGRLEQDFGNLAQYFRTRCLDVQAIAEGNLSVAVVPASDRDVFGIALESMRQKLNEAMVSMRSLADEFSGSANALGNEGRGIEETSKQASHEVANLDASIRSIEGTIESVTEGSRLLAERIHEITRSSQNSARASGAAKLQTRTSETDVVKLQDASREVEKVVEVITEVADQTRLLALNATIEAARAGEAGKGFGVVAGEVKELASRTAKATEEIAHIVEGIRTTALAVAGSIGSVRSAIEEVDGAAEGILHAVSEQQDKVKEMSDLAEVGARGVSEVGRGLRKAGEQARQAAEGTSSIRVHADAVKGAAAKLQENLRRFKV